MIDRDDETGDGGAECGETLRLVGQNELFPGFEGQYYQRLVHRIFTRSSRDPVLFANSPAFRPASARASRSNTKRYPS
jgi:hypothetical protein